MTARKKKPAKDPLASFRKMYPGKWVMHLLANGSYFVQAGENWIATTPHEHIARAICRIGNK